MGMSEGKDQGRVLILAGDGKGKTTSALGTALRAVGHGMRALVIQFVKHQPCGEHAAAERLGGDLEVRLCGTGMLQEDDPRAMREAAEAAQRGLDDAREALASGDYGLVVLDEVLIAVGRGLLDAEAVRSVVAERAPNAHVVLTGNAPYEPFADLADTITLMESVRHPYRQGRRATPGIEF